MFRSDLSAGLIPVGDLVGAVVAFVGDCVGLWVGWFVGARVWVDLYHCLPQGECIALQINNEHNNKLLMYAAKYSSTMEAIHNEFNVCSYWQWHRNRLWLSSV
jgi:hypothetical protein